MNFVSLFAGVGGFDLAFERAGMDCVGQVEIDAKCREVLAAHWPNVPRFEDVHEVKAECFRLDSGRVAVEGSVSGAQGRVNDRPGIVPGDLLHGTDGGGVSRSVDVLCGGFPCQDYSVAGKRGGLAGDRGALWWQFHRLIAECRPRWVVGENVPGLLSSNGGRDFGAIVGSLVELGYGVVWRVLDAQYFGVAQRRRRVFIVGHSGGIPRPEILAFAEGCTGDTPPSRQKGAFAAGELARSLGGVGGGQDYGANKGTLIAFDERGGSENWTETDAFNPPGQGSRHLSQLVAFAPEVSSTLQSAIRGVPSSEQADGQLIVERSRNLGVQGDQGGVVGVVLDGGFEHPIDEAQFLGGEGHGGSFRLTTDDPTKPAFNVKAFALQDVRGMAKDQNGAGVSDEGVAYTLDQTGAQGVATSSVRRLTPLECERLQGFPDNWTASQSDTQRYRQMGNAVAVPVAEWIGQQLVKAE